MPLTRLAGLQVSGVELPIGGIAAAGAAMLPDLDQPQASVSQTLGPISRTVSRVVAGLAGGHRQGTHSLFGLVITTAGAILASTAGGVVLGLYLAFLASIALAAFRLRLNRLTMLHTLCCLGVGVALTGLATRQQLPLWIVPTAVAIGVAAHLLGDCLTREGCPLLWPVLRRRVVLLRMRTDSLVERWLIGPALGIVAMWLIWRLW